MKFDCVIFDFDGTTANTSHGVLASLRYAIGKVGETLPPEETLRTFIGPSLYYSFTEVLGYDEKKTEAAIAAYREFYSGGGVYDCVLYDGIEDLFKRIKAAGAALCVASGKPQYQLDKVIRHFGLDKILDGAAGPDANVRVNEKEALIRSVIKGNRPVMVGDAVYDVAGARAAGVPSIAVTYGFTRREVLEAEHPDYIADSVKEVSDIIFG